MSSYLVDLLIESGDVVLDSSGLPVIITGRDVIAQDIGHRLEESGLVFLLLGDRSQGAIKSLLLKIRLEVENDKRIIPGTVKTDFDTANEFGTLTITAETLHGDIEIAMPLIKEREQESEMNGFILQYNGQDIAFDGEVFVFDEVV